MTGTLTTCSVSKLRSMELEKYDIKLFIALRTNSGSNYNRQDIMESLGKYGFFHRPKLGPTEELFKKTQLWKKDNFTLEELRYMSSKNCNWWGLYEPMFRYGLEREDTQEELERIELRLKEGKNLLLVCYCGDASTCHRSIVGNYFKDKGYTTYIN